MESHTRGPIVTLLGNRLKKKTVSARGGRGASARARDALSDAVVVRNMLMVLGAVAASLIGLVSVAVCVQHAPWDGAFLVAAGTMTVAFTYCFGMPNLGSQMIITAALTATIASALILILETQTPFQGGLTVPPRPFEFLLQMIHDESTAK